MANKKPTDNSMGWLVAGFNIKELKPALRRVARYDFTTTEAGLTTITAGDLLDI